MLGLVPRSGARVGSPTPALANAWSTAGARVWTAGAITPNTMVVMPAAFKFWIVPTTPSGGHSWLPSPQ